MKTHLDSKLKIEKAGKLGKRGSEGGGAVGVSRGVASSSRLRAQRT